LDTYTSVFNVIGWFAVGIGVILLLLSGVLRKLMHGCVEPLWRQNGATDLSVPAEDRLTAS
jgi:hypothetical protein